MKLSRLVTAVAASLVPEEFCVDYYGSGRAIKGT
ncbi:hypothetical protein OURE66S_03088 [Oligella ureolytica]